MPTWDSTVDTWDSVTLLWHPTADFTSAVSVNFVATGRLLETAAFRAALPVNFDISGNFTRSGSRDYRGIMIVRFNINVDLLYAITDLAGTFDVSIDIPPIDWYVGEAWPPSEIAEGPWYPSLINLRNWIPVDDIGHFDG